LNFFVFATPSERLISMRFSIRYQLLLPLLALMLGVVAMSTWTAWSSGQRERRRIESQMEEIADTVNSVSFPLNTQTFHLMKGLSGADFLLCDEQKVPIEDDGGRPKTTLPRVPVELPIPRAKFQPEFEQIVQVADENYLCIGVTVRQGTGQVLYVFYPESRWREAVALALRPALILGILGSLASILLTLAVTQRTSSRIQELDRRTRSIAAGDFSRMPLPRRNDELRDLAQSVNDMAQRLAEYRDTIRATERLRLLGQVSGGLAHQLRNGVTGAKLAVQLHMRETPGSADSETLQVALRQLSLVEIHLKRFLDLGKSLNLDCKPCDLRTIAREVAELMTPQCRHANITLQTECVAAIPLIADEGQLGQLLLNLLTNAVEAAGPGGWVALRCGIVEPGHAYLEIIDSGPGPSADVAERLFEPFVTGKPEGVGLGLAVARQVADAHGGRLSWRHESEGTCFRIELPLAPASIPTT
jgi:signal transduction histidine kinase